MCRRTGITQNGRRGCIARYKRSENSRAEPTRATPMFDAGTRRCLSLCWSGSTNYDTRKGAHALRVWLGGGVIIRAPRCTMPHGCRPPGKLMRRAELRNEWTQGQGTHIPRREDRSAHTFLSGVISRQRACVAETPQAHTGHIHEDKQTHSSARSIPVRHQLTMANRRTICPITCSGTDATWPQSPHPPQQWIAEPMRR